MINARETTHEESNSSALPDACHRVDISSLSFSPFWIFKFYRNIYVRYNAPEEKEKENVIYSRSDEKGI